LYVADTNHDRVLKFDAASFSSTSTPAEWSGDLDPDPARDATIVKPLGLVADSSGVYIGNHSSSVGKMIKIKPDGSTIIRNVYYPGGFALHADGHLYVATVAGGGYVNRYDSNLNPVSAYFTGNPTGVSPTQVAFDSTGALYVSIYAQSAPYDGVYDTIWKQSIGSGDNKLTGLTASGMTLTPTPFSPDTSEYTASVASSVYETTVTPVASDSAAAITVNSVGVASGGSSPSIALSKGDNTVSVVVTAVNGAARTYAIKINRALSADATLSGLAISPGALNETFNPGTLSYSANVANNVTSIGVTPNLSDDQASVEVNHTAATSGSASTVSSLAVGPNTVIVSVTAEDGVTSVDYTIVVTRATPSPNADLSGLSLSNGTLSPAFSSGTTNYAASVGNEVDRLSVSPILADAGATATVNGAALASGAVEVNLNEGSNPITILVTAQDGSTKTYAVTVTRASPPAPQPSPGRAPEPAPFIDLNGTPLNPGTIDPSKPLITLEATPKNGAAYIGLSASILAQLADVNEAFIIEFKTPYGSYRVPADLASQIPGLKDLLTRHGITENEISFKITLSDKSGDGEIRTAFAAGLPRGDALGAIVDFQMEIVNSKSGKFIGTVHQFDREIARLIPMPMNVTAMPERWGAFRYNAESKRFEFVPAKTVTIDDVLYVTIASSSNSVYVVAENKVSFDDTSVHWSRPFVELAAAKG
ncbi:MAG: cadherin-like beta sandwich domain-containing protein, partial [Cohnella sp.]|nr:cadherin-like beta sandwich domain-containing protein [Cohnella sp.]